MILIESSERQDVCSRHGAPTIDTLDLNFLDPLAARETCVQCGSRVPITEMRERSSQRCLVG
jgi:hypothetical protein